MPDCDIRFRELIANLKKAVIPAKAGIQRFLKDWIPASAGMMYARSFVPRHETFSFVGMTILDSFAIGSRDDFIIGEIIWMILLSAM
jgi:hypothetical protein